ncbi:conserved hypothetical protein [Candidatus Sulfopaludibacter sp. SbA6]|nr:conserved hypothetical protein [Candidatus Sulfopaludibacter sp. SbA6]
MRTFWLLVPLAVGMAQTPPPVPALVRGVLLERDTGSTSGEFSVRAPDNQVYRYQFDRKTYVERDDQMIDVKRLEPGEKVEVVSDVVPGLVLRYARTIHVLPEPPPARPSSAARLRAARPALDRITPTGNLTFSGVVFRLTGERIVLHTREGGEQSLLLRKDTRYVENGEMVEAANLKLNMRVFVRAGKDLYDQLEAYQVIWGNILEPR